MQNLSVVIITRNRLEKLKRSIESVKKTLPGSEIIVVDNDSSDGTIEYLKNNSSIKPFFLDKNNGVAKARNIGIKIATKKYLMFLDDDAWIDSIDINSIDEFFISNNKIAMVAPKILYPSGNIQESIRNYPTIMSILWRGLELYKLFPNVHWYKNYISHNIHSIHEIDWSIGACQIFRKDIFCIIGYLDEKYFFGYEDVDFCFRAKKKNYSIFYWPQATIYHEYNRSSAKGINRQLFRHIASIIRFFSNSY